MTELKEGDIRTITINNEEIIQVYKCTSNREALCDKNQRGCIEQAQLASIPCNRKNMQWCKRF